jgi:hypothetical protein
MTLSECQLKKVLYWTIIVLFSIVHIAPLTIMWFSFYLLFPINLHDVWWGVPLLITISMTVVFFVWANFKVFLFYSTTGVRNYVNSTDMR